MRRRWIVAISVAVATAAGLLVVLGRDSKVEADAKTPPLRTIVARVEKLRDLRFEQLPKVERVSRTQLRERAKSETARMSARERRQLEGGGDALKMLGFIPVAADVVAGTTDVSDIAGLYDFRTKRLTLVNGAPNDVEAELTYAHELLHALEDDAIGIKPPTAAGADDAALAYSALAEGSATLLEGRYADRYLGGLPLVRRIARGRTRSNRNITFSADAYYRNSLRFLYEDGARFAAQLYRRGGNAQLERTLRANPPVSSAQILHPEAYFAGERPAAVPLRVGPVLGRGWGRVSAGTFGEFDTSQLLLFGAAADDDTSRREAAKAAAGWAGGRYELWRTRDAGFCPSPCAENSALVVGWHFDSPQQAAELAKLVPSYLQGFQHMKPAGREVWQGSTGSAAFVLRGADATLVLAPRAAVVHKLALSGRPAAPSA
jgi:hypothetical protein